MTLLEKYTRAIAQAEIRQDRHQRKAVQELQALYEKIVNSEQDKSNLFSILSYIRLAPSIIPVKGLYLWGGVGRGKTWLMDMFFESIPGNDKQRFHFHHFMQYVHTELAKLKGQRDPLKLVAAKIAKNSRTLCIDEFHVEDIADAMLLNGLLENLFQHEIVLVATSNQEPDDLYKHGLQRSRFMPAIELVKTHTNVIHLEGREDYRCIVEMDNNRYITTHNEQTLQMMQKLFESHNKGESYRERVIQINKRPINTLLLGAEVVWFDFEVLCGSTRASMDYMKISQKFSTVLLSMVPILSEEQDDKARRFVNLIDELYDKKTYLIIAAEAQPQHLYTGRRLSFEFSRTASRLVEMRSRSYPAQ